MAKPLVLNFNGTPLEFGLQKVDREKLYGYVEFEVVDEAGKKCELVTLAGDGKTQVGKGGTGLAYFSPSGEWRKKAELTPVDIEGNAITPVKSTFDAPVELDRKATIDDLFSHNIHTVYQLTSDSIDVAIVGELGNGTIYTFPFSYRGGLEANVGFVLLGADGNLFLLVGSPTYIEFIGLNQPAPIVAEDSDAEEEEESLDFSMM